MLEARLDRSWLACRIASAGVLLLLTGGCPGDDAPVSDSSAGTSTGLPSTSDATVAGTGTTDGTSTGGTDSTTDGTADGGSSSDTGTVECVTEPTEALPAVLQVSLEILNDTPAPVYVLGPAEGCTEFEVIRDGLPLPLELGPSCGCECPAPGEPTAEAVALDPGQSHVITWDGRLLALYQERFFCNKDLCVIEANGSPQPLQPSPVTMTIPIYTEAGMYAQPAAMAIQTRCASPLSFSVEFELGTADVSIPVALSEVVIR